MSDSGKQEVAMRKSSCRFGLVLWLIGVVAALMGVLLSAAMYYYNLSPEVGILGMNLSLIGAVILVMSAH